jgi:hypothetical protein
MKNNPNPQGKGLVPILDSLTAARANITLPPKHIDQITNELFTSLFILHSRFNFKPVIGKSYWLYRRDNIFQLSLISPVDGDVSFLGQFIGECMLQHDVTWTLTLDQHIDEDDDLLRHIEERRTEFEQSLHVASSIDHILPVYLESLPYYQRVFASALANSLKVSMQKSGIQGLSYAQAKGLLGNK